MRVNEGDFAYDIEPVTDRDTLVFQHFRVSVLKRQDFGFAPVFRGTAKTMDEAKSMAERELQNYASGKKAA